MWQLSGTTAQFASTHCQCLIDLSLSQLGLKSICVSPDGSTCDLPNGALLQLDTQGKTLEETYARGRDLFVRMSENDAAPFRMEAYWRAIDEPNFFGFEAIVSVQTSRWEVTPEVELSTHMPGAFTPVGRRASLVSLPPHTISYLQIAHTSNHQQMEVEGDCIKHRLFGGQLEKGVIRRARIRGLFLPAAQAAELAAGLQDEFERSPPPLTT